MKQSKSAVASAVAAVITNANLSQAERDKKWLAMGIAARKRSETFAVWVAKMVKASGMTIFTLVDAKHYAENCAKESGIADSKKAQKSGANALAWFRRELRASGVKVESDARGGANNKTGKNASTSKPKDAKPGLSKWNEAMALILQAVPELTTELDRLALTKLLAKLETQHKAQLTK